MIRNGSHPHSTANGITVKLPVYAKRLFSFTMAMLLTGLAAAQSSPPEESPTIKLLDAGSAPRKALRFHVKAGDKESTAVTMKIGETFMAGQSMKTPAIKMPMDIAIQGIAPNKDITYEMTMGEASITNDSDAAPGMVAEMKSSVEGLKGSTAVGIVSDRGISKQVDMKLSTNASPTLQQTMDQMKESLAHMSAPFPEEAVGSGAKWEVKSQIKSGGIRINQTATYQLVSLDGDKWVAKCTLEESAARQRIENPSMGDSVQATLLQMTGKGGGTMRSDLTKLIPLESTMEIHINMDSEIKIGENTRPMSMKMDVSVFMLGK